MRKPGQARRPLEVHGEPAKQEALIIHIHEGQSMAAPGDHKRLMGSSVTERRMENKERTLLWPRDIDKLCRTELNRMFACRSMKNAQGDGTAKPLNPSSKTLQKNNHSRQDCIQG